MIVPLPVGNALRVFLEPPAGATLWRILRKGADTFTGETDPNALVVYEGTQKSVLDVAYLNNETAYFYRAYYWDGTAWTASATVSATPQATYADASTDALSVVRDRLDYGLTVEVARGTLVHDENRIKVLTAPPLFDDTRWPVVTVHLQSEVPAERALGEELDADYLDALDGEWIETEGWLAKVQLMITGWCLNPDERIELRKTLRRIVVANLPVFDDAGMVQIEFSQQDVDAVSGEYPAPVYQVMCCFSCLAPVIVRSQADAIADVTSTIISD